MLQRRRVARLRIRERAVGLLQQVDLVALAEGKDVAVRGIEVELHIRAVNLRIIRMRRSDERVPVLRRSRELVRVRHAVDIQHEVAAVCLHRSVCHDGGVARRIGIGILPHNLAVSIIIRERALVVLQQVDLVTLVEGEDAAIQRLVVERYVRAVDFCFARVLRGEERILVPGASGEVERVRHTVDVQFERVAVLRHRARRPDGRGTGVRLVRVRAVERLRAGVGERTGVFFLEQCDGLAFVQRKHLAGIVLESQLAAVELRHSCILGVEIGVAVPDVGAQLEEVFHAADVQHEVVAALLHRGRRRDGGGLFPIQVFMVQADFLRAVIRIHELAGAVLQQVDRIAVVEGKDFADGLVVDDYVGGIDLRRARVRGREVHVLVLRGGSDVKRVVLRIDVQDEIVVPCLHLGVRRDGGCPCVGGGGLVFVIQFMRFLGIIICKRACGVVLQQIDGVAFAEG